MIAYKDRDALFIVTSLPLHLREDFLRIKYQICVVQNVLLQLFPAAIWGDPQLVVKREPDRGEQTHHDFLWQVPVGSKEPWTANDEIGWFHGEGYRSVWYHWEINHQDTKRVWSGVSVYVGYWPGKKQDRIHLNMNKPDLELRLEELANLAEGVQQIIARNLLEARLVALLPTKERT